MNLSVSISENKTEITEKDFEILSKLSETPMTVGQLASLEEENPHEIKTFVDKLCSQSLLDTVPSGTGNGSQEYNSDFYYVTGEGEDLISSTQIQIE